MDVGPGQTHTLRNPGGSSSFQGSLAWFCLWVTMLAGAGGCGGMQGRRSTSEGCR